eukprot:c13092_g1_i1.p1 GENE.c13092_g1_i1~~c13092_g1_i1.p1  ORF type:complete len:471 (+),score=152.17 c13092_g1_i1:184-1413(+)
MSIDIDDKNISDDNNNKTNNSDEKNESNTNESNNIESNENENNNNQSINNENIHHMSIFSSLPSKRLFPQEFLENEINQSESNKIQKVKRIDCSDIPIQVDNFGNQESVPRKVVSVCDYPNLNWETIEQENFKLLCESSELSENEIEIYSFVYKTIVDSSFDGVTLNSLETLFASNETQVFQDLEIEFILQRLENFQVIFQADSVNECCWIAERYRKQWSVHGFTVSPVTQNSSSSQENILMTSSSSSTNQDSTQAKTEKKSFRIDYQEDDLFDLKPWIRIDGQTDGPALKIIRRAVLAHILHNPGITENQLFQRLNTLTPQQIRRILTVLEFDGSISKHPIQPTSAVTLFSNPFLETKPFTYYYLPTADCIHQECQFAETIKPTTEFSADWVTRAVSIGNDTTTMNFI